MANSIFIVLFFQAKAYKYHMKNKLFGTPKLRFLYSLLIFQLVLYTIFRIVFLIFFKDSIVDGNSGLILHNLWLGVRFDARLAMAVLLPAMIFINLRWSILHHAGCMPWLR